MSAEAHSGGAAAAAAVAHPAAAAGDVAGSLSAAADQHQQQLQADAFKRLYPEQFFARFAAEGLRPDGRGLSTPRAVSVGPGAVGAADGSAIAKVGSTAVLAGCRLEVAIPPDDAPDRGQLLVSAELTPLCRGDWRPGRPAPEAAALATRVSELLLSTGVLDTRQLCIAPGAAIWVLYLDLYVLDAAGGLLDAALLAALAALRDCRVPHVHVTEEGNVERGPDPDASSDDAEGGSGGGDGNDAAMRGGGSGGAEGWRPLVLGGAPVCLTFGLYKGQLVVDPDNEEEALMGACVSVVVDGDGSLLGVYKPGGTAALPTKTLLTCYALAQARQREVAAQMDTALQQHREQQQQPQGG